MVPVTTKPYLNSVNFIILQQGIPAFFLSIKEKTNRYITSCLRDFLTYKLQCILVSEVWITDPASLRFGDNSTNASNLQWPSGHSLRSFLASLIKEDFYNGKSSGI
jgi:hypothetical protein